MKTRLIPLIALCIVLLAAPALAAKSPACETLGEQKAAEHLSSHIYAYTCYWDGENPSDCTDEGCAEYGHLHCYGRQVSVWDTPMKGKSRVAYYPHGSSSKIGPDTEFQLVDVVEYRGKYYANIRILVDYDPIASGFVSADYIGCTCETYEDFIPVPEYDQTFGAFDLR